MVRSTWKAVLLLILTFALGAATGLLAGRGFGYRKSHHAHFHGTEGYLRFLDRQLDLSPEQQDSIAAILERQRSAMDSLWREIGPQIETLRLTIRSEIRAHLTPSQQQKYQAMTQEYDAKWRRMKESRKQSRDAHDSAR